MPLLTTKKIRLPKKFSITQKIISISFLIVSITIIITILCFNWVPHATNKNYLIPNIASLFISLTIGIIFYFIFKKLSINNKTFRIIAIIAFILLYLIQLFILYFSYFKTGWDAGTVNNLADQVAKEGVYTTAGSNGYLTTFENNTLIVSILALIKSLPIIGGKYFIILAINALLVNLAGIFTCLTVKKLISNKAGLLSIFVTAPLIILSPWIIIPYSDTFTITIPILVFYIYIATDKWWKYGLIFFFSIIGYYIKPSAIIVLIAILLIKLLKHHHQTPRNINKDFWLRLLAISNGIICALLIKYISYSHINYQQIKTATPVNFTHYLAMGQNEENYGQFLATDYQECYHSHESDLEKFFNRFTNRSLIGQASFFLRKLLVNFDDGSFAWGGEGEFYKEIPKRDNPISNTITNFYYNDGVNNQIFLQTEQMLWIFVLFGCIFIYKKKLSLQESVLQLSLIGIFVFVMIFEARARYVFCFAPMFIVCAMLGYHNLTNIITRHSKIPRQLSK